MNVSRKLPKGVSVDRDRFNNVRLYFRKAGYPKVRLREEPGTKAFDLEVACARLGLPYEPENQNPQAESPKVKPGSLQWLLQQYKTRARDTVSEDTFVRRAKMLEEICDSRTSKHRRGDLPYKAMEKRHITEVRDALRDTPGARNNVVKALSALFDWAEKNGLINLNPAHGISRVKADQSHHAWTVDEVHQFETKHPEGSKARLFLHLALFTGLRISDLAQVGRQHIQNGWLKYRPTKTQYSSSVIVEFPILPPLQETINSSETGDLTLLISDHGRPFTKNGLGNRVRKWCDAANLAHCSAHGLRKAGATIAAENGATDDELMAIFGWTTKQQTTLYTRNANRKRLAGNAIHKLLPEQRANKVVPPKTEIVKSGTKVAKKTSKTMP